MSVDSNNKGYFKRADELSQYVYYCRTYEKAVNGGGALVRHGAGPSHPPAWRAASLPAPDPLLRGCIRAPCTVCLCLNVE